MSKDNKQLLLRLLSEKPAPVALAVLISDLDYKVTERTVRRWLSELIRDGPVVNLSNINFDFIKSKPLPGKIVLTGEGNVY